MNKVVTWFKENKVIAIIGSCFLLGGIITAILTTCLPSYQVTKAVIIDGPKTISGVQGESGTSPEEIQYEIEGNSKNGGKAPIPNFSIEMIQDQTLPSWLSISENKISWTNDSKTGIYSFYIHIIVDNINTISDFSTTLTIS